MRQAGIIAAGGLYALKNNVDRLKIDHRHAKMLEAALVDLSWVQEVIPVETNIVVAVIKDGTKRDAVIEQLASKEIKIMAFGPGMLRFVTHLDVSEEDIEVTIRELKSLLV